jgi:hypothetical protein
VLLSFERTLTVPSILPVHTLPSTPAGPPPLPTPTHTTARLCPSSAPHGSGRAFINLGSLSTSRVTLQTNVDESSEDEMRSWEVGEKVRVKMDR